jgi:hypothetical protein
LVNTSGEAVNAAEGQLQFNPAQLEVVRVARAASIFNLWVSEPSFSNQAGTITFSGGVPAGFTGASGEILSITLRAKQAGSPRLNFENGAVLANDGRGTNVLTNMQGGTYTIQVPQSSPEPERVEYVPVANTPAAPQVASEAIADPDAWYQTRTATLTWTIPAGVTAMRSAFDQSARTIPTDVTEPPLRSIILENIPEGENYYHLQFRNADGWGGLTRYRVAIDTMPPAQPTVVRNQAIDPWQPTQELLVESSDAGSGVALYRVRIGDGAPFEVTASSSGSTTVIRLADLPIGSHLVFVEAVDAAGNAAAASISIEIESFTAPRIIEYPSQIAEDNLPVVIGETRPNATVVVTITRRSGGESATYETLADATGRFTFIPPEPLSSGVYALQVQATDATGAQSELTNPVLIHVQQPGYIRVGEWLISFLSVLIPLIVLVAAAILLIWFLLVRALRFRRSVSRESTEALTILRQEFTNLIALLDQEAVDLAASRKSNELTKAERETIETLKEALRAAEDRVEKEMKDVTKLTDNQT